MTEWAALDEVKEDEKYLWVELMVRKPHFLGSVLILDTEVSLDLEDWGRDGLAKTTVDAHRWTHVQRTRETPCLHGKGTLHATHMVETCSQTKSFPYSFVNS